MSTVSLIELGAALLLAGAVVSLLLAGRRKASGWASVGFVGAAGIGLEIAREGDRDVAWLVNGPERAKVAEAKAALETEGATLARERLAALADLIQSDPERAIELAVPDSVRDKLPAAVRALIEERIDGASGHGGVLARRAPDEAQQPFEPGRRRRLRRGESRWRPSGKSSAPG